MYIWGNISSLSEGSYRLGLLDLGQASVEDGALIREVDAIELLNNLLLHQLFRPAVRPINDYQPVQMYCQDGPLPYIV